jgi:hypothetical protein
MAACCSPRVRRRRDGTAVRPYRARGTKTALRPGSPMRPQPCLPLSLLISLALTGCAVVAGTSDLEPCEGEACGLGGAGGGGGATSGPGGGSNTTTSTSTGAACFDVTVVGQAGVRIRADVPETDPSAPRRCAFLGSIRLRAFCGTGAATRSVSWGNLLCADGFDECSSTFRRRRRSRSRVPCVRDDLAEEYSPTCDCIPPPEPTACWSCTAAPRGRWCCLRRGEVRIGRSSECEVRVEDDRSRRSTPCS